MSDASFRPDNDTDDDEDEDALNDSNVTESSFIRSVEKQRVERKLAESDDER